jgi:hypothetical protein
MMTMTPGDIAVLSATIAICTAILTVFGNWLINLRKVRLDMEKTKLEIVELRARLEKTEAQVNQGTPFFDFDDAVQGLTVVIERHLAALHKQVEDKNNLPLLHLKLIAVGLHYSQRFLDEEVDRDAAFPKLLRRYHDVRVDIEILFVDGEYLEAEYNPGVYGVDWVQECKARKEDLGPLGERLMYRHPNLNSFTARKYKMLPQWHGWLINNDDLFLGTTTWEGNCLKVGQNQYRYLDAKKATQDGGVGNAHVEAFRGWHTYLWSHSEPVCSTSRTNKPGTPTA